MYCEVVPPKESLQALGFEVLHNMAQCHRFQRITRCSPDSNGSGGNFSHRNNSACIGNHVFRNSPVQFGMLEAKQHLITRQIEPEK